jgi:hypothetical protein
MIYRRKSCDMHTQFSKWNIVQNTQDSKVDGFVTGFKCFSYIQQYRPFFPKNEFLPSEKGDR